MYLLSLSKSAHNRWHHSGALPLRIALPLPIKNLRAASYPLEHGIEWLADDVIKALPVPADGILYVIGDGSHKDKRASKNPLAQKGRKSQHHPWFFGIRFALLIVAWDVYRIPVAFRIILPKTHPQYRTENALFRDMLSQFTPPSWAALVLVEGDAAYGSKANITWVKQLNTTDRSRDWYFVFAISRTWKTVDDKASKDLVQHLPRRHYQRTWLPRLCHVATTQNLLGLCQTSVSARHWRRHLGAEQNRA